MSAAGIGQLLTHFDLSGRQKAPEKVVPKDRKRDSAPPVQADEATRGLDESYRRGYAAGLADLEAKLGEERASWAVKLGEARAQWSDQEAAAVAKGVTDACGDLESKIAGAVARILQPFLAEEIRQKAVAALVDHVSVLISDTSKPVLRITGPGDLLDAVKQKLATERPLAIEYSIADGTEVRVVADQTVIETQIEAWIGRLREASR